MVLASGSAQVLDYSSAEQIIDIAELIRYGWVEQAKILR